MTLVEYQLHMEAYQLKRVAKQRDIFMQAFANQIVKSTKGKNNPKPVYTKFDQLFNEEKEINKVRSEFEPGFVAERNEKQIPQKIFAKRLAEFHRLKKAGQIIPLSERRKGANNV
ncbi:hypothetical protein DM474_00345 [Lactobacillus helveticus]|uniref:hypothetical protein n=1 Tax=Lactobacillus helveticus TaxID=1587 RepID=UPI000D7BDE61|nr:hypothetical protein [Lactobacillus helveticus]PXZ21897.1 hypothetical protein DM474_00345 [Lactobacillus helveticus]